METNRLGFFGISLSFKKIDMGVNFLAKQIK